MTKYCCLRKRVGLSSVSLGVLVDGFMLGLGHHLRHLKIVRTRAKEHHEFDHGRIKATMPRDPLIGLVGKPSSGKSTTLNRYGILISLIEDFSNSFSIKSSLTDASSKVGKSTVILGQIPTDI